MDDSCMYDEMTAYPWKRARGVSLIELGMVMVFMSLALVPVIKMIGGPESSSGKGNAARLSNISSKQGVLANTMVDRVLSADFTAFNCDTAGNPATFDPKTQLPQGTTPTNSVKVFNKCKAQNTNSDLYYQWTVVNLNSSNNGNDLPQKNQYYQATLNVMDENNKILLTMPTNFLFNDAPFKPDPITTGISFTLDISNSMADADTQAQQGKFKKHKNIFDRSPQVFGDNNYDHAFSSPYLFYRYSDHPFPNVASGWGFGKVDFTAPPNNIYLNKWDNTQLDLVAAQSYPLTFSGDDPDTSTPFNEGYPFAPVANPGFWGVGLFGSGDCTSAGNGTKWKSGNLAFTFLPLNSKTARYSTGSNEVSDMGAPGKLVKAARQHITGLCEAKTDYNDWSETVNQFESRIEAARTAAVSMLLQLEAKPNVAKTLNLGFIPWGRTVDWDHQVALEAATTVKDQNGNPVKGLHFKNMRDRLLWINRADPNSPSSSLPVIIQSDYGTRIDWGLRAAMSQLNNGKTYTHKVVILMTDGFPAPATGTNDAGSLKEYAYQMGKQGVILYAVGLIEADPKLLNGMVNEANNGDPTGERHSQAFIVDDVAKLKDAFDVITYQIQKQALLDMAARYNITL